MINISTSHDFTFNTLADVWMYIPTKHTGAERYFCVLWDWSWMWHLTDVERGGFFIFHAVCPCPTGSYQSSSSSSSLDSLPLTGIFSPLLQLLWWCLLLSVHHIYTSFCVNECQNTSCRCSAASTQSPPSLPVYSLLLWPPPLCCAIPSPLDWASASLVSGVVVVDSAGDDSTAWTGSQLHMRRALHGPTAKCWRRTQTYPAVCSGASGMRTTMLLEVRASHDKKLWMFTTTQLTVLTSFWRWFQWVSY